MSLNVETNVVMPQNQMAFKSKKIYISKGYRKLANEVNLKLPRYMTVEEFKKAGSLYPTLSQSIDANVLKMTKWELIKQFFINLL